MVNEILSQSLVESVDTGGVVWKMPSPCYFKLFAWNAPRNMNPYEVGIFGIVCSKVLRRKKPQTYPTKGREIYHLEGTSTNNILKDLYILCLRFVGSIFVVLLVWRSPFCFFFQRHQHRHLGWPPVRHPPSLIHDQKLGLQFVTGMTLLGNYYIVMFINQLLSGLIIPNSLVSCVMWMELLQELGVFKVSARFW